MKAVRWYDATFEVAKLRRIADGMLRDEYLVSRPWGFRLAERRKERIEGAYYERVEHVDTVTDPFGRTTEYPRTEFRVVSFAISMNAPSIELIDPPRSAGEFFAHIAAYASYDVALSPIGCGVGEWLGVLQKQTRLEVLALEVTDMTLDVHAKGTLQIEGTADIRAASEKIVGRRAHRISRATIRWHDGSNETVCEIQDLGRAKIRRGDAVKALRVLRAGLAAAIRR
jgi:hypothetical protein